MIKQKIRNNIKSWKEATKPFREAAKKSNFSENDLKKLLKDKITS